jgi:small subunit ribosomal protein S1
MSNLQLVLFCSGLLHVSKITHGQVRSVSDVLAVGDRVKALVIKSPAADRIALRYTRANLQ